MQLSIVTIDPVYLSMQVESLLDEATAELGKLEFSPMLATIEISFRIIKAVPLHATLRLDCEVRMTHMLTAQMLFANIYRNVQHNPREYALRMIYTPPSLAEAKPCG